MSFENIGNTKDSKDYKTILKDIFNKAVKSAKIRFYLAIVVTP